MKKRLFTILTVVLGTMFMVSCGSDDPDPGFDPAVKATNEKILGVLQRNYLWSLPANPNLEQETPTFFGSLLSQNDRYTDVDANGNNITYTYSRISPVTAPVTRYDAGFEYAINKYVSGVTYYVILYVKPGTDAANYLARGLYISKVNGTTVTAANAATLLPTAYNKGEKMKLSILTPMITNLKDVDVLPKANYIEAPMLTDKILSVGAKKVGYICYNSFTSGSNGSYDNALANKLAQFKNEGVTTLVFDVRYNSSGNGNAITALGSALVKNRNTGNTFIQLVFRSDLPVQPLNFKDQTLGGTAIPKLGDNLEKIYIITGQTTAGAPEALINSIKAYRNADIVIVGEKSKGRNIATANASENSTKENPTAPGNWNLTFAYNYLADVNKNANYAATCTPNTVIKEVEVAATKKILLGELGTPEEVILSEVLKMIAGTRSVSAPVETRSAVSDSPLQTSLGNRPGSNETTVELQQ